jgi:hypothetical protein
MARAPQIYDLPEDHAAIQSVINKVGFYPLSALDPTMKTIAWAQTLPGPAAEGGGETKWVVPENFFGIYESDGAPDEKESRPKHEPPGYQACMMRGEMWPRRQKTFRC